MFKNLLILSSIIFSANFFGAQITNMSFRQTGDVSRLTFVSTGDFQINKSDVPSNKQIVLNLSGVSASSQTLRPINTSEFSGSTVYVSAKKENSDSIKVVVQLRENVQSRIEKSGDKVELLIENRFGAFQDGVIDAPAAAPVYQEESYAEAPIDQGAATYDVISNLTQSGEKRYIGSPISINVKDAPLVDVMNLIAETSGFNIIMSDSVSKRSSISLSMNNVPWDEALDSILSVNELVAEKHGNVLKIITKEKFLANAKKNMDDGDLLKEEDPIETRIFTINHGDLEDIAENIRQFQTKGKGTLSMDKRSHKVIVRDTAENINKMTKIIDLLDTRVPQVLIEARIVEVNESLDKEFGLNSGVTGKYQARPNAGPGRGSAIFDFNSASLGNGLLGGTVSVYKRLLNLDFNLRLLETERKAKIITSPRIVTKNKKTATISTSDQTSYRTNITIDGAIETDYQPISADLVLNVTPLVSQDGSIELDIDLKKESFTTQSGEAPPDKTENAVKTNVVVDNGSTIVIGGIYQTSESREQSGVPLLRKIPIIGWLFSNGYNPQKRRKELMVFITPRIINQKNADFAEVID